MRPQFKNDAYDVSGSIVAYKTDVLELRRAAESFLSTSLRVKLTVIDNSPTDSLREAVEGTSIEYIHTARNIGFGAAHNIALRQYTSQARYHLVLNPDVQFGKGVLEELTSFLDANPSVGLVMPQVLYPDGSFQYRCMKLPTPFDAFSRRFFPTALKALVKAKMYDYELRNMDFERILSVPHLSGCFMFVRMKSLQEVGLFDQRFFIYYDDTDLVRRIHERYCTVYYPRVKIFHSCGKGSYRSLRLLAHHCVSAVRYFNKWGWIWDRQRTELNRAIRPIENLVYLPTSDITSETPLQSNSPNDLVSRAKQSPRIPASGYDL
jgi:GT2 family glycosyltransferase